MVSVVRTLEQFSFQVLILTMHERNKHFVASYIKDLLDNIEAHKIIDFINDTRFISNFNVLILMFVICFFILAL